MTVLVKKDVTRDYGGSEAEMDLISSLAKSLSVNTSGEMDSLRDVLYPSLLCAAVYKVDTKISISTHILTLTQTWLKLIFSELPLKNHPIIFGQIESISIILL